MRSPDGLTFRTGISIHLSVKRASHAGRRALSRILPLLAGMVPILQAAPPGITELSGPQTIQKESSAAITVTAPGATSHQWFRGTSGDSSSPVAGATGPLLVTPPLRADTSFWVRAGNADGSTDSAAVIVTIGPPVPGRLLVMGANYNGQLGDESTTTRKSPVLAGTDVAIASAGANHTLFLGGQWSSGDPLLQVISATPAGDNLWDLTLRYGDAPERLFLRVSAKMTPSPDSPP